MRGRARAASRVVFGVGAVATACASLAAAASCSLTSSLDGLTGGGDGATPSDGGAFTPSPQPGERVLGSSDFESASSLGCGAPWVGTNATTSAGAPARSGSHACLVCMQSNVAAQYAAAGFTSVVPDGGDRYRAEAWVRAVPDASKPQRIVMQLRKGGGAAASGAAVTIEPTWQRVEVTWVATEAGATITADVMVTTPSGLAPGDCFLLDDAALYASP